jgi:hypothetical protein
VDISITVNLHLLLTQWLNRYLQFVSIMNRSDDSIYNLNYPVIDKVLKSLAARLQVDSKYNRDNTDDISKNSAYSRGMFVGLAKLARDLAEQKEFSHHRRLQGFLTQTGNIENICSLLSSHYYYNMKKVSFHHWRKLLHKKRKLRYQLQVVERDLWQDNRISNIFFTSSICQRCVQRFGKVRLATLFHNWTSKRRIFSMWLHSLCHSNQC